VCQVPCADCDSRSLSRSVSGGDRAIGADRRPVGKPGFADYPSSRQSSSTGGRRRWCTPTLIAAETFTTEYFAIHNVSSSDANPSSVRQILQHAWLQRSLLTWFEEAGNAFGPACLGPRRRAPRAPGAAARPLHSEVGPHGASARATLHSPIGSPDCGKRYTSSELQSL